MLAGIINANEPSAVTIGGEDGANNARLNTHTLATFTLLQGRYDG